MRDGWVDILKAAKMLGTNRHQAARLCRDGKINGEKCLPRGGWLVEVASIESYREQVPERKSLDLKEAIQASNLYLSGDYSIWQIGRLLGVTAQTVINAWDRYADSLPMQQLETMKAWWAVTHGHAKLTPRQVQRIRRLKAQGIGQRDIGLMMNIDHTQVSRIHTGEAWGWVP